jgi:hypothetical protein
MRPAIRTFLLLSVLVLFVLVAATGYGAWRAMRAVAEAKTAGELLQRGAEEKSADLLEQGLSALQGSLENVQAAENWLFAVKVVPQAQAWSVVVRDGVQAGQEVVAAGQELVGVLREVQGITGDGALGETRSWAQLSSQEKQQLIHAIEENAVRVVAAQANVDRAAAALSRIDPTALPQALRGVPSTATVLLREASAALGEVAPFLSVVTHMAGTEEPVQWLVLYLNNSELRPGGGFIGFYALATVKNGEITALTAEDSYATDMPAAGVAGYNVRPPQPLADHLGVTGWFFRDSAWSPDFAETAKTATQLLRQQEGIVGQPVPNPQIVLGLTPQVAAELVRLVGPLQLGQKTVTAEELYDVLQYDTQKGFAEAGRENNERKLLVELATKELMSKLMQLPPEQLFAAWNMVSQQMHTKQAALFSTQPEVQQAFAESGWTATLPALQPGEDFLALIDANLGALKTDPAITRQVDYTLLSVDPEKGIFHAVVQATYTHSGSFDYKTTRYQTYAQLLVPPGARLLETSGGQAAPATTVSGYTSLPQWVVVEPGQTKTVLWAYELPADIVASIRQNRYQLQIVKQLGGGDNLLTLDHTFDRNITTATPSEQGAFGDGRYELQVPLTHDMVISVGF